MAVKEPLQRVDERPRCYVRLSIPFARPEFAEAFASRVDEDARVTWKPEPRWARWWVDVTLPHHPQWMSATKLRQTWARRADVGPHEHMGMIVWPTDDFDRPLSQQLDTLFGASRHKREVSVALFPTGAGWASGVIATPTHAVDIEASAALPRDAFWDLPRFALEVLNDAAEARCSFPGEPGESRWVARRTEGRTHVRLFSFPDAWSGAPDADGNLLLEAACSREGLASAVHRALARVRGTLGEEDFAYLWHAAFPSAEFDLLGRVLEGREGLHE